jgi:hypothetical protein
MGLLVLVQVQVATCFRVADAVAHTCLFCLQATASTLVPQAPGSEQQGEMLRSLFLEADQQVSDGVQGNCSRGAQHGV